MNLIKLILIPAMLLLNAEFGHAQLERDHLYKHWRFFLAQYISTPARTTLEQGKYSINTRPTRGYKIGLEYHFMNCRERK
ncbi:MAG TPA: hypothetical protein VKZ76_00835 [Edaphocola sp.]|nr:hypothetical protein [Edaphocola sp.]